MVKKHKQDTSLLNVEEALKLYATGKYTIQQIADLQYVSAGKMYYALRDAGCKFIHTRRKAVSPEERLHRSLANKGKIISEEQRRLISERNSCNYNGLNGYGHTKNHNRGYVLVYVPKHPRAHKDGYLMLHTVLMERKIGRYLKDDEVVHHINHNRTDNRIENLLLMKKREHMSMHMKERHAERKNHAEINHHR